eukprot:Protomagalhaensia_wolfi_Nauph_80__3238@NODE_329_length_2774_cov_7_572212_g248_i0_p1_GENE_NODE_329_length_2774_cov_7_572212_g248_i0NODE_329_length_2774_cov_7_572212_g248_i0_p1_ORF_typecomplete_len520_score153_33PRP21_like_P/PF12230_8/2_6e03PRP21_like_P/PF12230_8/1_7e39Surp/PF01805_20/2_2e13Surp/PF01805_20/7_5e19_NODE_329_length_2774_cov_7_572212_g248_i04091968
MSLVAAGPVQDVVGDAVNPYQDVVFPPPQQRTIIDKTAGFIAQNGPEFETRMLREPDAAERFAFLTPSHPYRPYYDMKVLECQTGKVEVSQPAVPQAIVDMRRKEEEKKEKLLMLKSYSEREGFDSESEGEDEESDTIEVPDKDRFLIKHPYIAPIDQEVVKLTAQFVAVNGKSFLSGLIQRERNNPQFDFLKPTHPTHPYFTLLIECYKQCFNPDPEIVDKIKYYAGRISKTDRKPGDEEKVCSESEAIRNIVSKMNKLHLWNLKQDQDRRAKEEAEAGERAAMAAIDWDNFVVVETIVFTEADSLVSLPAPLATLDPTAKPVVDTSVPLVPMAQQKESAPSITRGPQPQGSDSSLNVMRGLDNTTFEDPALVNTANSLMAPVAVPKAPVSKPEASSAVPTTTTLIDNQEATVVLKPDYVRRGKRGAANAALLQKCPITGQLVAPEQMEQHLRVVLIDPQWKRQRDDLLQRAQREKMLSPEMDVEANIAQFVMKRPDLFGTVEDELLEHAPPKKRPNV